MIEKQQTDISKLDMKNSEQLTKWKETYEKIERKLEAEMIRLGDRIPYIADQGIYSTDMRTENISWWTNGFWAGMLWQMYHASGKEEFKNTALKSENAMDEAMKIFVGLHHDVGFMWLHTAVADYRLTGSEEAKTSGLHAANLLAGRYNPIGKFIRAWNRDCTGWMIVDCLMNIPLLFWANRETEDPRFDYIARQHANTAMRVLMREDGSCNHIAVFDAQTGELKELPAGQGYASGSSWSRGQAWAIYGFALAYLHTGDVSYLDTAKKAAHYFISNIALTDYISLVDFRAPEQPVKWDTTAAACAACGLFQIADMVSEHEKGMYYDNAVRIMEALDKKHCNWNPEEDGILQNGTAAYHREEDTHVPIIYGDYFFVEGILRMLGKSFQIW